MSEPVRYVIVKDKGISSGVAAILSLLVPGLGQLCQGRWTVGLLAMFFTLIGYMLFIVPGIVLHVLAVVDAARQ